MDLRRIGIGWALASLALLGHVAGADCCLIRGAARDALAAAHAARAPVTPHACCGATTDASDDPAAPAATGVPLPECSGLQCAPVAALDAPIAPGAPASPAAAVVPAPGDAPEAPAVAMAAPPPQGPGPPTGPAPRASRGRAPPIA